MKKNNVLVECILIKKANKHIIFRADGAASIEFCEDFPIDINRFLEECQVDNSEDDSFYGYEKRTKITLGSSWVMKSWWKNESIQRLFYPNSSTDEFRIKRQTNRRLKERLSYDISFEKRADFESFNSFFSTAEPMKKPDKIGPPRKRGQMIWAHKTAPEIEIEGSNRISPEELSKMRRR